MARRTRMTRPYPVNTLDEAIPIAETIQTVNGGQPVATDLLAQALGTTVKSSVFVQKLNSSVRYGLTTGSHTADQIELTKRGESLTAPRDAGERTRALRAAAIEPDAFRGFYLVYAGKRFPEGPYASNTLVREFGIRQELTEECLRIIKQNGLTAGIVVERFGELIVDQSTKPGATNRQDGDSSSVEAELPEMPVNASDGPPSVVVVASPAEPLAAEVIAALDTLSIPITLVDLAAESAVLVAPATLDALRSARGCIVVWPRLEADAADRTGRWLVETKVWLTIGAAASHLGDRIVVVSPQDCDTDLAAASDSLDLRVIGPTAQHSVYPVLVSALVEKMIVRISLG